MASLIISGPYLSRLFCRPLEMSKGETIDGREGQDLVDY